MVQLEFNADPVSMTWREWRDAARITGPDQSTIKHALKLCFPFQLLALHHGAPPPQSLAALLRRGIGRGGVERQYPQTEPVLQVPRLCAKNLNIVLHSSFQVLLSFQTRAPTLRHQSDDATSWSCSSRTSAMTGRNATSGEHRGFQVPKVYTTWRVSRASLTGWDGSCCIGRA